MVDNFNKVINIHMRLTILINHFCCKITYWVAETILSEVEIKDRVNAIKKFVTIAEVSIYI